MVTGTTPGSFRTSRTRCSTSSARSCTAIEWALNYPNPKISAVNTDPGGCMRTPACGYTPLTLDEIYGKVLAGQAVIVDGEMEILPGVKIHPAFRAHTAGSQLLEVPTSVGKLVFGSDAYSSWEGIRDWMVANVQQTNSVQQFLAYEKCYKITGGYENCVAAHEPLSYTDKYPLTKNSWEGPNGSRMAEIALARRRALAQALSQVFGSLLLRGAGRPAPRMCFESSRAGRRVPRLVVPALALALMLASAGAGAHDPSAYGGLFRSRDLGGDLAQRRRRAVPERGARGRGRSARPQPPADGHRPRPAALAERRAQLDARRPGPDHRRRVRARFLAGRPERALRRPERRVPLPGWRLDQRRGARAAPRRRAPSALGARRPRLPARQERAVREATTAAGASSASPATLPDGAEITALAVASEPERGAARGDRRRAHGERGWRPAVAAPRRGPGRRPDRHGRARPGGAAAGSGRRARTASTSATIWARPGAPSGSRCRSPARTCAASRPIRPRPPWS